MKITFVSLAHRGGMHHYLTELVNAVAETGVARVTIVIPKNADASSITSAVDVRRIDAPEFTAHEFRRQGGLSSSSRAFLSRSTGALILNFRELNRVVQSTRPDVVHLNSGHIWYLLLARRFASFALLASTLHDITPHPGENTFRRRREIANLLRWSRVVFVHTATLRQEAERYVDAQRRSAPGPVFVEVRHGDYLQFGPLDTSRRDQRPTGLFFGRIRDYKGVDVLLDALPIIHTRIPDFRLIVAGSGADRRLRRRLFESEGVEFEDRFIEDREIPVLFGRANVVILPYGEASWSGVASLAANFGVPVIASAIDGLLDHLAPDTAARLVPPGDPQRLADAVTEHFLDDWGGSDARQSRAVVEQVSWSNAASITVATYCKLLS